VRVPIAVVDFVNETNEEELDGLSGMLITALEQSRRLSVLTRSRMFDILKQMGKEDVERIDEALGRELCQQAGVNAMALASVKKFGRIYTLDLKLLDTEKNEYIFAAREQGEGQESVLTMIDNLAIRTRQEFNEQPDAIQATSEKLARVTTQNFDAYQHFFKGEQLFKQDKWQRAEKEYLKAIEIDSTFGLAYYRLARIKAPVFGREANAMPYMQRALALMDRIPEKERYLVRAQQARFEKGFEEALVILKEMEKYYPDDEEMLLNIGNSSFYVGINTNDADQYLVAAKYLEKVLELDPENIQALSELPNIYEKLNLYEKMLAVSKRYVSVVGSVESYMTLKHAYVYMQNYSMAMETMRRARELFPQAYFVVQQIAFLYIQQEQYDEAHAELLRLVSDSQPQEAKNFGYNCLANFYPYVGKFREAIKCRDMTIEGSWQAKDTSRTAFRQLEKARLFLLGWSDTTTTLKEGAKALEFKDKVLKDPFVLAQAAFFYSVIGDYSSADSMGQPLSRIPSLMWIYPHLKAFIGTLNHECDQAKAVVDDEIIGGGYIHLRILLLYFMAKCQFEIGALDEAIDNLHKLQAIHAYVYYDIRAIFYPKSFNLLGKIYEAKGDKRLATQKYEKFLDLWKDADEDLPDLIDAKTRLAKLRGEE